MYAGNRYSFVLLAGLVLLVLSAASAVAGPPIPGTYTSIDQAGGTILLGRASESWPDSGAGGQMGNTQHGESWDGTTLGTQWEVSCPAICVAPIVLSNTVDSTGTGQIIYQTGYCGGTITLRGTGEAWGGGDAVYTATIQSYTDITTYQFSGGVPVGAVTNVNLVASFDGYDNCLEFAIGNGLAVNSTDYTSFPSDYPCLLDPGTCLCGRTRGGWGDVSGITLTIRGCAVPTEKTTWGRIKARYE
jgi:hypothetical protein